MDRRGFFRQGLRKVGEATIQEVQTYFERKIRWIRPPYALDELEFLLTCTRCGECISACPYHTIFPLSASVGTQVANTPALDLLNNACHLCPEWHCLKVCQPRALRLPQPDTEDSPLSKETSQLIPIPLPRLSLVHVDKERCLPYKGPECGACKDSCPVEGALTWRMNKPYIIKELCVGCALCRMACIVESKAIIVSKLNTKTQ
jgi:ferredoxin-type protein NapG